MIDFCTKSEFQHFTYKNCYMLISYFCSIFQIISDYIFKMHQTIFSS